MYTTALKEAGSWNDDDFVDDFRAVPGIVLVLRIHLASAAIDQLLGVEEGRESILMVSALGCVLFHSPAVRVLHPSFADFLSSQQRCTRDMW